MDIYEVIKKSTKIIDLRRYLRKCKMVGAIGSHIYEGKKFNKFPCLHFLVLLTLDKRNWTIGVKMICSKLQIWWRIIEV